MKRFLLFSMCSGIGWFLDSTTLLAIVYLANVPVIIANYISSIVGLTYVWFVSINKVFDRPEFSRSHYIFYYWSYQIFSVFLYSYIVSYLACLDLSGNFDYFISFPSLLLVKVFVTPFNLFTNYLFMRFITGLMHIKYDL